MNMPPAQFSPDGARRSCAGTAARLMVAIGLLAGASAALPQAPRDPPVNAYLMGTMVYRGNHKGQRYLLHASVVAPGAPQSPGGSAAFAVDDSGTVFFIGKTEYQPSQALTTVRRHFETPKPPMTGEQAPRYLMVCSWPVNDAHKMDGSITTGYAERNDSATSISKDGTLQETINVKWVAVPSARVGGKFARIDYCGEVAKTGKSSAPIWMLPGKEN